MKYPGWAYRICIIADHDDGLSGELRLAAHGIKVRNG
jgi:hypothetical protein